MTNSVRFLSIEEALEEVSKLEEKTEVISEGSQVFTGIHPEHGPIHIILSLVGQGIMILPIAFQQFAK